MPETFAANLPFPIEPLRSTLLALSLLGFASCSDSTGPSGGGANNTPARMDIAGGDLQTAQVTQELAQPLVVRVLNDKGKPVSGQLVNFVVTSGAGHAFAGSALTNADGEARERWTLGTVADTQKVEARAVDATSGEATVFAVFRAIATPGAPATVAPLGSGSFTALPGAPLPDSISAVVKDQYGNPVPGTAVVWTVKAGGGSVSPGTSNTGANGVARTAWTLGGQIDSTQVLEAAAGLTVKSQFTANVKVPVNAQVVVVSGDDQTGSAGGSLAQPLVVRVQFPDGRAIPGVPVKFEVAPEWAVVNPVTVVTDTGGRASTTVTLAGKVGVVGAFATIPAPASASFTINVNSGPPAQLLKQTAISGIRPGSTANLRVQAVDAFGNVVRGATVTWSATVGAVTPSTTTTDYLGEATTQYAVNAPSGSTAQVTATAGGASVTYDLKIVYTSILLSSPVSNAAYGDILPVNWSTTPQPGYATIRTGAEVEGIRATYPGGGVQGPSSGIFRADLDIGSLAPGAHTVRVWAVSNNGDSVEVTRTFNHIPSPRITGVSLVDGTVLRDGNLSVDASCDRCTEISISQYTSSPSQLATGTSSAHGTSQLADGSTAMITISASNALGGQLVSTSIGRQVFVETSPRLSTAASVGGRLLDLDDTRLLYAEAPGGSAYLGATLVKVQPRSGGSATRVDSVGSAAALDGGRLFGGGALYSVSTTTSPTRRAIREWRGGSPATVDSGNVDLPKVAGEWAAWGRSVNTILRRDLQAGTTTTVSAQARGIDTPTLGLAENGDVAFTDVSNDVEWLHGGTLQQLTSDPDTMDNLRPVTDGARVMWLRGRRLNASRGYQLQLWNGSLTTLASYEPEQVSYVAANGWIAYTLRTATLSWEMWVAGPDGTRTRILQQNVGTPIAVGPHGEVVFTLLGRVYAMRAPYTSGPVDIGTNWSSKGAYRFLGSQLYLLLGRSAFSISF